MSQSERMLSLGPWYVAPRKREDFLVPFGASAKPKLVMDMTSIRVRFVACILQGRFVVERFSVDGDEKIVGRCDCRNFVALFPSFHWPLLGPGSKVRISVTNPTDEGQMFAPTFKVRVYEI